MQRRRKIVEIVSTMGLLLVAVGLMAPFASLGSELMPVICRWVFAAGALIYAGARMVNVNEPKDSTKLRRLRRMEMWAGFCFVLGGAFWFYNAHRFAGIGFTLPVMRDTIAFTMAGAIIQVIASWMITARQKKESEGK